MITVLHQAEPKLPLGSLKVWDSVHSSSLILKGKLTVNYPKIDGEDYIPEIFQIRTSWKKTMRQPSVILNIGVVNKNGIQLNSEESICNLFDKNLKGKVVPKNLLVRIGKFYMQDKMLSLRVWFNPDLSVKRHASSLYSKLNQTRFPKFWNKKILSVYALVCSQINSWYSIWGKST